ncbi:MAG: mechanosensitive ion channel [Clostridia bacterium]|nr:mechanosensitive ion channel [Clostridia bacterium]
MEARKTNHMVLKLVIHYLILLLITAAAIVAFFYRGDIDSFFAKKLTGVEIVDVILNQIPLVIKSIQLIIIAILLNLLLKGISKIGFGLTDKTKTIINMILSLLKWIIIIATILLILSVFGVNTTTLLAGAGIVALIIGLGAQSLISDILAGIFIVFEGKYVVGDIVVIDGWRGKITSIGIRTTELQDIGGNIKIINNSEIKSVINQTKFQSVALCSINVSSAEKLTKVEEIIKNNLPQIRKNIPAITEDISYKGVQSITDTTTELLFGAQCYEEDLYQVQRDLQRELKLLLDNNKIECFAPPTYVIDEKKNK